MKRIIQIVLAGLLLFACAEKQPVFCTSAGAINGYDPVAYFTEGKPAKGKAAYSCQWMEAKWFFSSKENQLLFESDPTKYAPQYGGYCAYGVAMGDLFETEPDAWKIIDEKLYLNYDLDIQKEWEADQAEFIAQAEANWPRIRIQR